MSDKNSYHKIKFGEFSKEKENYSFVFTSDRGSRYTFIRHSESAIRNVVKDLGVTRALITRDKDWWWAGGSLTQSWNYHPKY